MIKVKDLIEDYGGHVAVDHLNFTVEDGFIYGLLGPNGAGKSTTMNMMTGHLGTAEGEIIIEGHNILEEPKRAKQCIGYLPEISPLYVDMTVMEYLEFATKLKNIPEKERAAKILRAVGMTKLEEVSHRLTRNLLKGYEQRADLVQVILRILPVTILDELIVGLSSKQIAETRNSTKELGKQHTVILSSHVLSEVQAVCGKIMTISHGRLVAGDTPENLKKMAGTHGMELTVKVNETAALEILEKADVFGWMTGVVMRQDAEIGETKMSFQFEDDGNYKKDIRETVFFALVQVQVPVLVMGEKKVSLEDVSLELTRDKKTAEEEQELLGSKGPDSELNDPEKSEEEAEDVNEIEDTIIEVDVIQETDAIPGTDIIPNKDLRKATHDSNL